jgi:hypothetical protein
MGARRTLQQVCAGVTVAVLTLSPAQAADPLPFAIGLKGLLDFRGAVGSSTRSWMDGGLGKTRYGGDVGGGRRAYAKVSEATLVIEPRIGWDVSGVIQLTAAPEQQNAIDIVEAYLQYKPVPTGPWSVKVKTGVFLPPISLENTGLGWTSPYTISSSAINTWVGEELRTIGGEATVGYRGTDVGLSLLGALYEFNDPAGTLMAWRGWALHDRVTGLFDRLRLAPLPIIQPNGILSRQRPTERPFVEIDDRVGYYAGARIEAFGLGTLSLLRYDNRADDKVFEKGQWPWRTAFWSAGVSAPVGGLDVLAQAMTGWTTLITTPRGPIVGTDFAAAYGLVSKGWGRHRLSLRADWFKTTDQDIFPDANDEHGYALTLGYVFRPTAKQRLTLEMLYIDSTRTERKSLGLPTRAQESQFQLSYRFFL